MNSVGETELVVRCPYCLTGLDFRPMIAHRDGRFVCRDCGHTVQAGASFHKCLCRECMQASRQTTEKQSLT